MLPAGGLAGSKAIHMRAGAVEHKQNGVTTIGFFSARVYCVRTRYSACTKGYCSSVFLCVGISYLFCPRFRHFVLSKNHLGEKKLLFYSLPISRAL